MKTKSYDPKDFVKAWQTLTSPSDVADKLNLPKEKVVQLASHLRTKGIPLKKMRKGPGKMDIQELIILAKKYEKHASSNNVH